MKEKENGRHLISRQNGSELHLQTELRGEFPHFCFMETHTIIQVFLINVLLNNDQVKLALPCLRYVTYSSSQLIPMRLEANVGQ